MQNIMMKVDGDKLVITVDLKAKALPSSTGKTKLVASTRGAAAVAYDGLPGLKVAVNVTIPA